MAFSAAIGAIAGSLLVPVVPWPVLMVVIPMTVHRRSAWMAAVALMLTTGMMSSRAMSGMSPLEPAEFDGWVTLVDDPSPLGQSGIGFTVRISGKLVDVSAHGAPTVSLRGVLAGERLRLRGAISPPRADDSWLRWRHVVGRLNVREVVAVAPAAPVGRFVNGVRRTLSRGAGALPFRDRALFLGMVIGDDRGQLPVTADDFRAAGLGHLLVVSGQNVAFVLAIVGPLVSRLRPGPRLAALLVLLMMFSLLTRFEPSVLRAVVMAGVSVGAGALDLGVDGRKSLAWAVAGLLVVDPFLVHSVAFQLSAAATAGLVLFSAPIAERLRGPSWFRIAFATTLSAQLAVSPLIVAEFGPMPLASLPANVLAEPVAGPVMMWGSTGGLLAGALGGWAASVIHLPTRVLLWWISGVASAAAGAPAATVGGAAIAMLSMAGTVAILRRGAVGLAGTVAVGAVVLAAVSGAPSPPHGRNTVGEGIVVWHSDSATIVVLESARDARRTLESLRMDGIRHIDMVVAERGNRTDALIVRSIRDRFGSVPVAAPRMHQVPGAHAVSGGDLARVGDLGIEFSTNGGRLSILVEEGISTMGGARGVTGGG